MDRHTGIFVFEIMADISDDPTNTYAMGFDAEGNSEAEFAGTNHTEYTGEAQSLVDSAEKLLSHYQMLFGDTSALPTYHLSRLAAEDITVALSGDGGDEQFAGYPHYKMDRTTERMALLLNWIPDSVRSAVQAGIDRLPISSENHAALRMPKTALELSEKGLLNVHLSTLYGTDIDEVELTVTGDLTGFPIDPFRKQ